MNREKIITTLTAQHRILEKILNTIDIFLKAKKINFSAIASELGHFEKDITEHLQLENEVFYPELLKDMKRKRQNTYNTEQFILEMENIEVIMISFFKKYENSCGIKDNVDIFRREFSDIVEILAVRIESEEEGIYVYWKQ